jgi:hypothetical protein
VGEISDLIVGGVQPIGVLSGLTPEGRLVVPAGGSAALTPVESVWVPGAFPPCNSSLSGFLPTFATTEVLDLAGFTPPFSLDRGEVTGRASRQPGQRAVAVDGAGQLLGPLVGGEASFLLLAAGDLPLFATALFDTPGGPAPVTLSGDQALFGTALVGYETWDCTGPALVVDRTAVSGGGAFLPPVGVAADGTLRLGGTPAPPVVVRSVWLPINAQSGCVTLMVPAAPVLEATVLADLSARPQPFGLALHPGDPPASGRSTAGGLTVVDAEGAPLGAVVSVRRPVRR